jgi:basic membrane protein A and related proteins
MKSKGHGRSVVRGRAMLWALAAIGSAALPACSLIVEPRVLDQGPEVLDIGFLYVGPVGDHGWSRTHDVGRMELEASVEGVTTHFAPSVAPSDAAARIDEFVARGDEVIVGTSFDFLVAIREASLRYPDTQFLICSGFETSPNLGSYFGRMEQVLFQAGVLAGRMTRTDRIGLVNPVVIPETVRHTNAFTRGVRSVNPAARVLVRWTGAWFDPAQEPVATEELIDAGVDVVFSQTDTTIPLTVSAEATAMDGGPVYSIGYDNPDSCSFAPDRCLASAYWNWGPVMIEIVESMQDGTYDPTTPIYQAMRPDPSESIVYLSPINETLVPAAVRLEVEALVGALAQDTPEARYLPFRGPVIDTAGETRVASGELPDDEDLLSMCWFVEGTFELDGTTPAVVPAACPGER